MAFYSNDFVERFCLSNYLSFDVFGLIGKRDNSVSDWDRGYGVTKWEILKTLLILCFDGNDGS